MTIGSLFSGIGGLERGLSGALGAQVVFQVEADPFCRTVLAALYPEARIYDDVQTVTGDELGYVDVLCGGFPCQDVSLAGKGEGLSGARSGLWREYARLVSEIRPRYVVVENVAALLGRGLGDVLGDLSALGYDAIWDCLPAAAVGAPHRRDRLYLVAWRVSDAERNGVRIEPERGPGRAQAPDGGHAEPEHMGEDLADADSGRRQELGLTSESGRTWQQSARGNVVDGCDVPLWPPAPNDMHAWGRVPASAQPAVCKLADGVWPGFLGPSGKPASRAAMLKALGNAVVPQVAFEVGQVIVQLETARAGK